VSWVLVLGCLEAWCTTCCKPWTLSSITPCTREHLPSLAQYFRAFNDHLESIEILVNVLSFFCLESRTCKLWGNNFWYLTWGLYQKHWSIADDSL
jgi:hypothetical protein